MATQKYFSPQEFSERLAALPEPVREYVYGSEMFKALQEIGKKHSLSVDQVGSLEAESAAAMLGFTELEDFPEMLEEALDIPEAQAQDIAQDIDASLFQRVRALMRNAVPENTPTDAPNRNAILSAPTPSRGIGLSKPMEAPMPKAGASWGEVGASKGVSFSDEALVRPTESTVKTVDVTGATTKTGKYTIDPYREPIK